MERWLILGEDARMKELAKAMDTHNKTVFFKQTAKWDHTINATVLDFCPTHIVLPIQPLAIEVQLLLGVKHVNFFAGRLNEQWTATLKQQKVVHYLQNETFIWRNAMLTAESFVKWWYERGEKVRDKTFIITGFGRVAKSLAIALTGLGAHVIIAVRSRAQIEEARVAGYEAIHLQPSSIKKATALINTIPAQWLTPSYHEAISMPIYDLASEPGCLYYVTREDYVPLLALPGKYFAKEAALLMLQSILEDCEC